MGRKVYGPADRNIKAAVGEDLTLELDANRTTGCVWRWKADPDEVAIEEGQYEPQGKGIGAGGKQQLIVRPLKSGRAKIRFEYVQPWEGEPARVHDVEVEADGD